jgi:hypothetical protein
MPDVVPDAPVESAWGNKIRNRTITPFATTAERDGYITAPVIGMECYVVATDSFYYYNGTAWKGRPRGRIAYVPLSTTFQTSAVNTWQTGLSTPALTAPETRLVRVMAQASLVNAQPSAAMPVAGARIATAAANLVQIGVGGVTLAAQANWYCYGAAYSTIGTAATTFLLQLYSNPASLRIQAGDPTQVTWLSVEDLGTP